MYIRTLLLILSPLISFSQKLELKTDSIKFVPERTIIYTIIDCNKGERNAIEDFNNGKYNYYTYGFTVEKNKNDEQIEIQIKEFLKSKYAINYEHKGCVLSEDSECYIKKMTELINQKFGKHYFARKLKEAYEKMTSN